eukprot:3070330-Rhodomonas_salina.1
MPVQKQLVVLRPEQAIPNNPSSDTMLVPLTRYARKPLATAVARPVSSLFSASKFSTVAAARRPASVRAPALTGAASSAPGVSVSTLSGCGRGHLWLLVFCLPPGGVFILHELWCNSIDQVARVQNGQMGGASMFPSKLFARALSTKEGEAKEEKKEEKKEEEPAAQSEVGGHADDQILHRPSREVVCCDKEMGVQGGEAKEEAKVETAEDKLAKAEEQIKTLEEEKKELKHKYLTALADVENMRQRMNHKAEEDKKFALPQSARRASHCQQRKRNREDTLWEKTEMDRAAVLEPKDVDKHATAQHTDCLLHQTRRTHTHRHRTATTDAHAHTPHPAAAHAVSGSARRDARAGADGT